ncbi:MAG: riboflavin synthase [Flavobacteriaceae bacterium]|nr:MAG: riboflavin synthase [Flavobacteriaceae bacterium]
MFTGIIENIGIVKNKQWDKSNLILTLESSLTPELKIDQSLAHNGVCLTVFEINSTQYKVALIKETLDKSNLGEIEIGQRINLERALSFGARLDGHLVQGHVDQTASLEKISPLEGSHQLDFSFENKGNLPVEKGSICINGVSLTVFNCQENHFSVSLIPYTWENTTLSDLKQGDQVNLEFDILGKYIQKHIKAYL